ncbi:hypothetical protein CCR75_001343 [Bremia lactucae]|uniref:Uncharacterized protein n=1 Tax=Bremia lactucae TaxID=4779 RepID=A0A976IBK3_BRELC|nr:hypothetical protein CCR75_001343 [Bremia lactucae]
MDDDESFQGDQAQKEEESRGRQGKEIYLTVDEHKRRVDGLDRDKVGMLTSPVLMTKKRQERNKLLQICTQVLLRGRSPLPR